MSTITILGGTGYAGSHIAREAHQRGHTVTVLSRSVPSEPIDGVSYRTGDASDLALLRELVAESDVVVAALSPRGALAEPGALRDIYRELAAVAADSNTRLAVVGGAGSLHVSEGGPLVADGPDFPEAFFAEAHELAHVLEDLRANSSSLRWFFVSPAGVFGAFAPGEALGRYRVGGDVLLTDDAGVSQISGADFALAFVDEIERPAHENTRFTVAY